MRQLIHALFESVEFHPSLSHHGMHAHGHGHHGERHGRSRGPRSFRGGDGDGDLFRSRKFSADDLQLLLLALLKQAESHGYQLIKSISDLTDGFYSPSPGMVYPALTYIEELGFARVEMVSNKKLYRLSPEGEAHLLEMKPRVDALFEGLAMMAKKMAAVRGAMDEQAGDESGRLSEPLRHARAAVKRTFFSLLHDSPERQARAAEILLEATRAIDALPKDRS